VGDAPAVSRPAVKAWGGRFRGESDPTAAEFGRSIEIDQELALDDLAGSRAHVRALWRAGLLTPQETAALLGGLAALDEEVRAGTVAWDPALEDVHLNLEMALTAKVGAVGGKLHTARSRNDQVATDLRLWARRHVDELAGAMVDLERALAALGRREIDTLMPGMTHVQPAQPILLAHYVLAHVEMLERDRDRLSDARRRLNVSPLGSGALAGAGFALDREAVAAELGFEGVTRNSLDAVGDRDFVVELLAVAALAMTHLSRLAEDLVWWSNPAFGWVRLSEAFSTGSSMMPNKRNPDPAELVRGRTARVIGSLTGVLAMLKGLPAGYQRDLQEDKLPLFDALAVLDASLRVMRGLIESLSVDREQLLAAAGKGFITATAVADTLVELGVAFRDAHRIVGGLVADAERLGTGLAELDDDTISATLARSEDATAAGTLSTNPEIPGVLRAAAGLEGALARFDVIGGTAPGRVRAALAEVEARLGEE
jgi:argininosuccinate lyase